MTSKAAQDMAGLRLYLRELLADESEGPALLAAAREENPGDARESYRRGGETEQAMLTAAQRRWLESHIRSRSS